MCQLLNNLHDFFFKKKNFRRIGFVSVESFKNNLHAFLILITLGLSGQTGSWMKTIKDSASSYYFSNPFYVEEDSLFMHVLSNTAMDPYFICGPSNGSIYYARINKQNGNVVSTCRLTGTGAMRGITAKHIKGSIYIIGEVSIPWVCNLGLLMKFNTSSASIVWSKLINTFQTNPSNFDLCFYNKLQTNLLSDKLYFFGNKSLSTPFLGQVTTLVHGGVDTSGTIFNGAFGALPTFTVTNAPYTIYKNIDFVHLLTSNQANFIGQNHLSNHVALFSSNSHTLYGNYFGKQLSIKSTGNNFVTKMGGRKLLYVVNDSLGTVCLLTDTLNNLIITKKIINLFCHSIASYKNSSIITLVNSINGIHGDHLYNIQLDTNLNPTFSRKMFLDTFRLNKFNCKTIMDSTHFANVFNFPINLSKDVYINRQKYNTLACNELSFTAQMLTVNVSTINAVISLTGTASSSLFTLGVYPDGFKDSLFCFVGETPNSIGAIISNSVCLGGVSSLSVSITNTPATFLWNFQNASINTSNSSSPSLIFNTSGLHVATITATNFYGSTTSTSSVRVWPNPTVSLTNGSICLGRSYTLQANGAHTYTFLGSSSVVSPTVNTTYSVIGTSSNGCLSTNTAVSQIFVWSTPTITIIQTKTLACVGENYTVMASGCKTYTWNSGAQGSVANYIAIPNQLNSISCTDSNGCSSFSQFNVRTSYCANEDEREIYSSAPIVEIIMQKESLMLKHQLQNKVSIEIYDLFGKSMFKKEAISSFEKVDFSGFSKGVYLIRIHYNEIITTTKLCYCTN